MIEVARYPGVRAFGDVAGSRRVIVEARADGMFQFVEECFYGDPAADDDHIGWQAVCWSGLYATAAEAAHGVIAEYPSLSKLPRFLINCRDVGTVNEFWQRYVDVTRPREADSFGRNLDAFWDALAGGPGCPGKCELVFRNSEGLASLTTNAGASFLQALREIATAPNKVRVVIE
jgi:ribonuclease inhibitor